MNNQAFSKIWIVVIILVLIAGGIFTWQYFGVPKEEVVNGTANWKTYRSEEYGYEVKYPPDFIDFYREGEGIGMLSELLGPESGLYDFVELYKKEIPSVTYSIFVAQKEQKWNSEEWIKTGGNFIQLGDKQWGKEISEEGATAFVENQGKIYAIMFFFIPEEGLSAEAKNDIYNTYLEFFNQMLSTFKFLE